MSHASGIGAFGYRQELKRTLSLSDLVVYGLVSVSPIAPWSTFGIVFNTSHGMVPLVYAIGFAAMFFTAMGYVTMSAEFPIAGSVYTYAGLGIGSDVGFLAGWALLLDYLLVPTLIFVICAVAAHAVFPAMPLPLLVASFLAFTTIINLLGIESTAKLSLAMLALQFVMLALFATLAIVAIKHGLGHFSLTPVYDAERLRPALVFGALSVAMVSFLGFDSISTLAEENSQGVESIGKATLLTLVFAAILFVVQTYLASLFVLDRSSFGEGDAAASAFYTIAKALGGAWFRFTVSIIGVLISNLASGLAAQAATARLLYSMARDGRLPKIVGHVSRRRKVPDAAILLIMTITLALGVSFANHLELIASMVSFGAMIGFLALHLSVMIHFVFRKRSRRWIRHLVVPIVGFALVAYVLVNAQANAKLAGTCWMAAGLAVLLAFKYRQQRAPRHHPTAGRPG